MIQLATDPNASRSNWRPAAAEARESPEAPRRRSGHAWPFIVRQGANLGPQDHKPLPHTAGGS